MTLTEVLSLLGLIFAIAVAAAGMWWRLSAKISANTAALHTKIDQKIDVVKADYARRDDMAQHMTKLESGQDRIVGTVERLNERLDQMLMTWVKMPPFTKGD